MLPTKLDSLGVEYGRLGSAVFARSRAGGAKHQLLEVLLTEMGNAVRLFGGAALPAHFPPYVGSPAYRSLTNKRVAAMLVNSRWMTRYFSAKLAGLAAECHFAHGLYVTLASARTLDENQARDVVAELCADLRRRGLPLRHAGSFGFDFAAAEWSKDRIRDRYVVRIAAPDLPTSLWGRDRRSRRRLVESARAPGGDEPAKCRNRDGGPPWYRYLEPARPSMRRKATAFFGARASLSLLK